MKKVFKKAVSLICGMAFMISAFACGPVFSAAASSSIYMRIEGQKSTVYSDTVSFTDGQDFYDIMAAALAAKNIPIVATLGSYGHEITSIGDESGTYPLWWHLYVNDKESEVGADSLYPKNGDNIVFYLGDDSIVHYPTVTISPENPVEGQQATINVTASYTDYSDYSNPVDKNVKISGATITFNGKTYTTDSNGNVSLTMPSAGNYTFKAAKETADSTPAIVRTGDIPLTVYTAATVPTGGSGSSTTTTVSATPTVSDSSVKAAVTGGANYLIAKGVTDWNEALALESAGRSVPKSFYTAVQEDLDSYGDSITPTHLSGDIIGLKAAGADPRNFNGKNLISFLCSEKNIGETGLNGYTYTLLALDSGNYKPSSGLTRDNLISGILSFQISSGAFTLSKNSLPDSDMTAAAITALSPYMDRTDVKKAVDSAITYLSKVEKSDGGFIAAYSNSESAETAAQVIIALSSAGINPATDSRFVKNGKSPLTNLLKFKNADGGFAHVIGGSSDLIATAQAVTALSSYEKLSAGKRIFNLTATAASVVDTPIKNPDTGDSPVVPYVVITAAALFAVILVKKKVKSY